MRRPTRLLIATAALSLLSGCLIAEAVLRIGFAERFRLPEDERSLSYQHSDTLGWFPIPGSERAVEGTRPFHVRHNARGFRDPEHGPKRRPRLLVLGDSFVWGFDAEQEERLTERLQARLPAWEVLNLGVSGYGTDQAYLMLREQIGFYSPEIVFLVFAQENDHKDNTSNHRYGAYYKPYFVTGADGLELRGVPVPRSLPYVLRDRPWLARSLLARAVYQAWLGLRHPAVQVEDPSESLIRATRELAAENGARFAMGVQGRDPEILAFVRREGIPAVSLASRFRYPHFGGHWTPRGHAFAAQRIYDLLAAESWLDAAALEP